MRVFLVAARFQVVHRVELQIEDSLVRTVATDWHEKTLG